MSRITSARVAVLDAAADILIAGGWGTTRMADVAARAGVSRQTVYNEYGSKDGLAGAVVLRETGRFLDRVAAVLDGEPTDGGRAIRAAVLGTLADAAENALLKAVLTASGGDDLLPLVTTRSGPVLMAAHSVISDGLRRYWPDAPAADIALAAEAAVRLTMSHLMLPTDPAEIVADRLALLVVRVLDRGGTP